MLCFKHRLKTEQEGFEPTLPVRVKRFSKPSPKKPNSGGNNDLSEAKTTAYKPAYKEIQKQGENVTSKLSPDLAEIVAVWPVLPDAIRSAIVTIVRASKE